MNATLSPRAKQGVALGILLLVILLVWNAIIWPSIDLAVARQSDVAALSIQVQQLREMERRAPSLGKREEAAVAGLQSLGVFWSGSSQASISAAMQDLIRSAAQQSGGVVSSSSALPPDSKVNAGMLGVRARVDGSLDTLQHVLAVIDGAGPKLFLSNLAVSAAAPATKEQPAQLSFEFSVSGYTTIAQRAR